MNTTSTQQEILLVKTSSYLCREWAEIKDNGDQQPQTGRLEEACWNGLIKELIPELFDKSSTGNNIYLWKVKDGKNLLALELSEEPSFVEPQFSLDPQFFLGKQNGN